MPQTLSQRIAEAGARGIALTPAGVRRIAMRGRQRRIVLHQIFKAMERQFDAERGKNTTLVVNWEIASDRGAVDRRQMVIESGRCRIGRTTDRAPVATLKIDDMTFLDLVTGAASGLALYMSGKIKIDGNFMALAQMQSLFRMPTAPAPRPRPG